MSQAKRRRFFAAITVVIVVAACVVVLLAAELFIRWQRRATINEQIAEIERFIKQPTESLEPISNAQIEENIVRSNARYGAQQFADGHADPEVYRPYLGFRDTPGLDVDCNSLGYRGPEFEIRKPKDVFRILVYGGSFIWGTGADDAKDTVPAHLERLLNENRDADNKRVEVINCGNSNYCSTQELIYLLTEGVLLTPDLVIFVDGMLDTAWGYSNLPAGYHGDYHQLNMLVQQAPLKTIYTVHELDHLKRERDHLFRYRKSLLLMRIRRIFDPSLRHSFWLLNDDFLIRDETPQHLELVTSYRRPEEYAMRHYHNIRSVLALGNEYGFESIFFIQPVPVIGKPLHLAELAAIERVKKRNRWLNNELAYWKDHYYTYADKLISECAAHQYPVVDLRYIFEHNDEVLYLDDCHLNGKGYALVAQRISQEMQSRTLLAE